MRIAFEMAGGGATLAAIAGALNSLGKANSEGGRFTRASVRRMLHNEAYLGVYFHGGVRVEGGIPAIVGQAEWDAAHARGCHLHLTDLSGREFGGRVAVEHVRTDKLHRWWWRCRHGCGHEEEIAALDLVRGRLPACPSCGGGAMSDGLEPRGALPGPERDVADG